MVLKIIFWVLVGFVAIVLLISFINKRKFVSLFSKGNVMLSGARGAGKDLAMCIVVNARKQNYISNIQYSNPKKKFKRFDFEPKVWELSGNTYADLITGEIKKYVYPYPDGLDYYISDSEIYFPAAYQSELLKKYKSSPMFQALSRQLGECNVHVNSQYMSQVWDKIRLQSGIFIRMTLGKVFFHKLCFLTCFVYDNRESCENAVVPPKFGIGKTAKEARYNFEIAHGKIRRLWFFSILPYNYDSRRFKKILENNLKDYEM